MPDYQFHQPYKEGVPDPEWWEFRMVPPDGNGWPDYANEEDPPTDLLGSVACPALYIEQYCYDEELAQALWQEREIIPSNIEFCVVDQIDRCEYVRIDHETQDGWLQVRACGTELSCSQWSPPLVLPAPGFAPSLIAGLVALKLLGGKRGKRAALRHRDQRPDEHTVGPTEGTR